MSSICPDCQRAHGNGFICVPMRDRIRKENDNKVSSLKQQLTKAKKLVVLRGDMLHEMAHELTEAKEQIKRLLGEQKEKIEQAHMAGYRQCCGRDASFHAAMCHAKQALKESN